MPKGSISLEDFTAGEPTPPLSQEDRAGVFGAMGMGASAGFKRAVTESAQAGELALGKPIEEGYEPKSAAEKELAAPLEFGAPTIRTPARLAYQAAEMLTGSLPVLGGAAAGAAAGAALTAETGPGAIIGGVGGSVLGAGLTDFAFKIAPYYKAALADTHGDADAAWSKALERASISGAFTGLSFGVWELGGPALTAARGVLMKSLGKETGEAISTASAKNLIAQATVAQPAVGAAQEATTELAEGNDLSPGKIAEAAMQAGVGTAVPLVGIEGAKYIARKFVRDTTVKPAPTQPGAEPTKPAGVPEEAQPEPAPPDPGVRKDPLDDSGELERILSADGVQGVIDETKKTILPPGPEAERGAAVPAGGEPPPDARPITSGPPPEERPFAVGNYMAKAIKLIRETKTSLKKDAFAETLKVTPEQAQAILSAITRRTPGLIEKLPDGQFKRTATYGPLSLVERLIHDGGLQHDPGGDLRAMDAHKVFIPGVGGLVRKGGMSLDAAALHLWERGYFPEFDERPTPNDLLEAIREDIPETGRWKGYGKGKVYTLEDQEEMEREAIREREEDPVLKEADLDYRAQQAGVEPKAEKETLEDYEARVIYEEEQVQRLQNIQQAHGLGIENPERLSPADLRYAIARKLDEIPIEQRRMMSEVGNPRQIAVEMTPTEREFFEEMMANPANRAELLEQVPSFRMDGNRISIDPQHVNDFFTYMVDTVNSARGEGWRAPPSFYAGARRDLISRMREIGERRTTIDSDRPAGEIPTRTERFPTSDPEAWNTERPYEGGAKGFEVENLMPRFLNFVRNWAGVGKDVSTVGKLYDTAAAWLLDRDSVTGHEHAVIIDLRSNAPISATTSRAVDQVFLPRHASDRALDPNSRLLYIHNHPLVTGDKRSMPLSTADNAWGMAPGMEWMVNVGQGGDFAASRPTDIMVRWREQAIAQNGNNYAARDKVFRHGYSFFSEAWEDLSSRAKELIRHWRKSGMTEEQIARLVRPLDLAFPELLNRALKAAGIIHYISTYNVEGVDPIVRGMLLNRAVADIAHRAKNYFGVDLNPSGEAVENELSDRQAQSVRAAGSLAKFLGPIAETPAVEPPGPRGGPSGEAAAPGEPGAVPKGYQYALGIEEPETKGPLLQMRHVEQLSREITRGIARDVPTESRLLDSLKGGLTAAMGRQAREPIAGQPKMGALSRFFGTPFFLGQMFHELGRLVGAVKSMTMRREDYLRQFHVVAAPYFNAAKAVRDKVDRWLEIADAKDIDPEVHNYSPLVNDIGGKGDIRSDGREGLQLSKLGDRVSLDTPEEVAAAKAYIMTGRHILEEMRQNAIKESGAHTGDVKVNTWKDAVTVAKRWNDEPHGWLPRGLEIKAFNTKRLVKDKKGRTKEEATSGWAVADSAGNKVGLIKLDKDDAIRSFRESQVQSLGRLAYTLQKIEEAQRRAYVPHAFHGPIVMVVRDKETGRPVSFRRFEVPSPLGEAIGTWWHSKEIWAEYDRLNKLYAEHPDPLIRARYYVEKPIALKDHANAVREMGINVGTLDAFASHIKADGQEYEAWREHVTDRLKRMGFSKFFEQRKGVEGYDRNFGRSLRSYMMGASGYLSRREFSPHIGQALKDIAISNVRELPRYAKDYMEYIDSGKGEADALRALTYMWTIGGNPSSFFRDLFQVLNITFPWLSMFAPAPRVAKELVRAQFEVMRSAFGKDGINYDRLPADIRKEMIQLRDQGLMSLRITPEQMALQAGRAPWMERINPNVRQTVKTIANFYGRAQEINRVVTAMTAMRLARADPKFRQNVERVMRSDGFYQAMHPGGFDPVRFAGFASDATHFDITRINRARMERGALGSLITQFKGFHFNNLALLYRLATGLYGREGQKAFAVSMGLYVTVAGLLGLPFASNIVDLIESAYKQLFGRTENLMTDFYDFANGVGVPQVMSEAIMHGSLRTLLGVELGKRLDAGNPLPTNPRTFLDPTELMPAMSVFGIQPLRALQLAEQGRYSRALATVLPPPLKGVAQAAALRNEGYRTEATNAKMISQADISYGDLVKRGLGFQTAQQARAADLRRAQSDMIQRSHEEAGFARDVVKNAVVDYIAARTPAGRAEATRALSAAAQEANRRIVDWNRVHPTQTIPPITPAIIQRLMREEMAGRQTTRRLQPQLQGLGGIYPQ